MGSNKFGARGKNHGHQLIELLKLSAQGRQGTLAVKLPTLNDILFKHGGLRLLQQLRGDLLKALQLSLLGFCLDQLGQPRADDLRDLMLDLLRGMPRLAILDRLQALRSGAPAIFDLLKAFLGGLEFGLHPIA